MLRPKPCVRRNIQLPQGPNLLTLPSSNEGRLRLPWLGNGQPMQSRPSPNRGPVSLKSKPSQSFGSCKAIRSRRISLEHFSPQPGHLQGNPLAPSAPRPTRNPLRLSSPSASCQILPHQLLHPTHAYVEFFGNLPSANFVASQTRQQMPNITRTVASRQLLIGLFMPLNLPNPDAKL